MRRSLAFAALLLTASLAGRPAAAAPSAALSPFVGLSAADEASLDRGEALVRMPSGASRLSAPVGAPGVEELLASMKRLGPNYLVEVMARAPGGSPAILDRLVSALSVPEGWTGIPYYSSRQGRTYKLYDVSATTSRTRLPDGEVFMASHHMQPFETYAARYEYHRGPESLVFSGTTTSPLVYKGVRATGPGGLQWRILAWRSGDSWYFYGVGAVHAFDLFGAARERLEPSFIGRTESFFDFMRTRFGG